MDEHLVKESEIKHYIAMLALLVFSYKASALEIENVKSGIFCQDNETIPYAHVCNDKERMYVMRHQKCILGDKKNPCISSGFEFDYKEMTTETKIKCKTTYKFSEDGLNETEAENKFNAFNESWTYELKFKSRDGHYVFPVSTVMYYSLEPPYKRKEKTECFFHEKLIFEYQYEILYPKEIK